MPEQVCSVASSCSSLTYRGGAACPEETPSDQEKSWSSWRCLVLLLVLTSAMRLWQIAHTEVISRDTLHYIRVAWQLEHAPWKSVLRQSVHHPGYPVSVLLVSRLVRPMLGDDLVLAMQLSAQVACALASILLVVPMFYLGRELFDRRTSFWGTLLFQCLPASGRVLGDGLSEGLFLFWSASGLLFAARGLRSGCPSSFLLCGLLGGLAFLTRPEGALLVAATGLVLVLKQCWPTWRWTWERLTIRAACLVVPAVLVALPYNLTIGKWTVKPSASTMGDDLTELPCPQVCEVGVPPLGGLPKAELQPTLIAQPLAIWWIGPGNDPSARYGWGVQVLLQILSRTLFWVLWVFTLIGLWRHGRRLAGIPLTWVMAALSLVLLALLYRLTVRLGYLSERHMLLILLCLVYPTAAGIDLAGRWLADGLRRLKPALAGTRWTNTAAWSLGLLLLLTVIPAVKSLEPLHHNRAGFRDVGCWLHEYTSPEEPIEDPFGWANFYAGRVFTEPLPGSRSPVPPARYVILEETGNPHPHLQGWASARQLIEQRQGVVIHSQPLRKGAINVYQLTLPPLAQTQ